MGYNLMFGGFHPGDFSKQKPLTNSTLSMAFYKLDNKGLNHLGFLSLFVFLPSLLLVFRCHKSFDDMARYIAISHNPPAYKTIYFYQTHFFENNDPH